MLKNRFKHMPDWLLKQIGLSHHLEGAVCYLTILLSRPLSLVSFFFFPFSSCFPPFLIPTNAARAELPHLLEAAARLRLPFLLHLQHLQVGGRGSVLPTLPPSM